MHPLFSIIPSQSGFIEMDLLQKMFLLVGHEKNGIYSKFVANPFKLLMKIWGGKRITKVLVERRIETNSFREL